jgi:hypothetical protein
MLAGNYEVLSSKNIRKKKSFKYWLPCPGIDLPDKNAKADGYNCSCTENPIILPPNNL